VAPNYTNPRHGELRTPDATRSSRASGTRRRRRRYNTVARTTSGCLPAVTVPGQFGLGRLGLFGPRPLASFHGRPKLDSPVQTENEDSFLRSSAASPFAQHQFDLRRRGRCSGTPTSRTFEHRDQIGDMSCPSVLSITCRQLNLHPFLYTVYTPVRRDRDPSAENLLPCAGHVSFQPGSIHTNKHQA
jgi:hypothetical protein